MQAVVDVERRVLPHFTEDRYGFRTTLVPAEATDYEDEPGLEVKLVA